jgi:hypothetical protein
LKGSSINVMGVIIIDSICPVSETDGEHENSVLGSSEIDASDAHRALLTGCMRLFEQMMQGYTLPSIQQLFRTDSRNAQQDSTTNDNTGSV